MPSQKLALPQSREAAIYAEVRSILTRDATLAAVVKAWDFLDGSQETLYAPDRRQMPFVRVIPGPLQVVSGTETDFEEEMEFLVTIATEGLAADDHLNLWAAFRAALARDRRDSKGRTNERRIRDAGAYYYGLSSPGMGPYPPPSRAQGSTAQDLFTAARIVVRSIVPF